jgi:hypothetical protein
LHDVHTGCGMQTNVSKVKKGLPIQTRLAHGCPKQNIKISFIESLRKTVKKCITWKKHTYLRM